MLPALGAMAGGAALKAGVSGLASLGEQKEREEAARRAALQQLSSKFQASTGGQSFGAAPEIPKAQSVSDAVVKPMLAGATQGAVAGALSSKDEQDDEWFKNAARGYLRG